MDLTAIQDLRASAEDAARRAGRVLMDKYRQRRTISFKQGIDPVTDADHASEKEVLSFLQAKYPDHSVLAEESGASTKGKLRWLIDPLDGTNNYAHAVPHFCVSIAVEAANEGLLAGAIYAPARDELFSAGKGLGATLNGEPIRVSETATLDKSLICTGFPFDVRLRPEPSRSFLSRMLVRAHGVVRMGAAALDMAYVAAGRFDGHFQTGVHPWDVAAGALLVTESGGTISLVDGAPFHSGAHDICAANGRITAELQAEVNAVLRELAWKRDKER